MTDVRIVPNLSILPRVDCHRNQASSAETGAVEGAVSAEPEALAEPVARNRLAPQAQVNGVLYGPQNEAIPIAGDTIGITFDRVVQSQQILVLYHRVKSLRT